jgi:putative endonuclease
MSQAWFVYILRCADHSLYTGITTDIERRLSEHNSSAKGAKYTRGRRPVTLAYYESFDNRSDASKREAAIKKLPPAEKQRLIGIGVDKTLTTPAP